MSLQFLRPEWFLALVVIAILAILIYRRRLVSRDWAAVIDASLLPHLLSDRTHSSNRWWFWVALLISLLVVTALAGPVWKKLKQPVFKQQSALVIGLDLSTSMNAQDIKPSRLARARLKLIDILKMRKEGQTALVAYAGTAYTVSPLTDDSDTIQSLVSSLTTDIMPAQGSRSDLALQQAQQLLQNAGAKHGDILLITDGISDKSATAIQQLDLKNIRVSILSVGTEQGAPIPEDGGGFVKDDAGSIVIAKTDTSQLRRLASELGGLYMKMKLDDGDISRLQSLLNDSAFRGENQQTDFKSDRWLEEGPWLLLVALPLAALAFRRGLFLTIFMIVFVLPVLQPVHADDGWNWQSLWKNQDQRAQEILQKGDGEQAAELFTDKDWKAAAHYKAGQYDKALDQLQSQQSADAIYNRANALAKLGKLQESLDAYDEALKKDPSNEDASYNRKLVEQALKQQQKQDQSKQGDNNKDDKKQKSDKSSEQKNQDQQNQNQDQKNQDKQSQNQNQQNQQSEQNSQQDSEQKGQSSKDQQKDQQNEQKDQQDQADKSEQQKQAEAEAQKKAEAEAQKQAETEQQKNKQDKDVKSTQPLTEAEQQQSLTEQAEAQWLRRIPDDPGGLLRNKFRYQYGRQRQQNVEQEQW
jgi:Ca-activated chloride channel homolog